MSIAGAPMPHHDEDPTGLLSVPRQLVYRVHERCGGADRDPALANQRSPATRWAWVMPVVPAVLGVGASSSALPLRALPASGAPPRGSGGPEPYPVTFTTAPSSSAGAGAS